MARKAILVAMADRANDDGSGIWVSKARIANEVECSKQTVITAVKVMVDEGLLEVVGDRRFSNGYTVQYNIRMSALLSLPDTVPTSPKLDPSEELAAVQISTRPEMDPTSPKLDLAQSNIGPDGSNSLTPPVKQLDPNRPRTAVVVAAAYSREDIAAICDRILAAGGPGMADPSKSQTPRVSLARRIHQWLASWDLELDILPVVAAKTAKQRGARPLGDLSILEPDIAYHHAQRLRPVPTVEPSDEPTRKAGSNGSGYHYGRKPQDLDEELRACLDKRRAEAGGGRTIEPGVGEDIIDATYQAAE